MRWLIVLCCAALAVAAGCGGSQQTEEPIFVPNDAAMAAESVTDASYVIAAGDFVQVTCATDTGVNSIGRVREDGTVALAMIGYVRAAGSTIEQFTQTLDGLYGASDEFTGDPATIEVVVKLGLYLVSGEVTDGGFRAYANGLTLYDAVASAGKMTGKAEKGYVKLYRKGVTEVEIIRYQRLEELKNAPQNPLQENDWVVIPRKVYHLLH